MGAKKFGMSLETQGIKVFWRDIPGFCQDIPEAPEKFEKKMFGFNSRPLRLLGEQKNAQKHAVLHRRMHYLLFSISPRACKVERMNHNKDSVKTDCLFYRKRWEKRITKLA